ncbi:MAG: Transcriptional regulator, MarR family [uncultured Paraburkholderia sp.]|nr:MAG: Transcriptional regulator, MarR family [uncultured Paraburkholderia sp.]
MRDARARCCFSAARAPATPACCHVYEFKMTDGPYKADEIRLDTSLGYYLPVESAQRAGRAH